MEAWDAPSFSVFLGSGYGQHEDSENIGHRDLRQQVYVVPRDVSLPDAIEFCYHSSFAIEMKLASIH